MKIYIVVLDNGPTQDIQSVHISHMAAQDYIDSCDARLVGHVSGVRRNRFSVEVHDLSAPEAIEDILAEEHEQQVIDDANNYVEDDTVYGDEP